MPPQAPLAPPVYRRPNQRGEDGVGPNRLGATDRLCETLASWRLLVGGLSPGASHHSFTTSSEEPPLSNFNSYRDIPTACGPHRFHVKPRYHGEAVSPNISIDRETLAEFCRKYHIERLAVFGSAL